MSRKHFQIICLLAIISLSFTLFNKGPRPKRLKIPSNFPVPTYDLSKNPITEEGFALGRKLFYDVNISKDSSISCASCHQQSSAFIQADHDLSHGVEDRIGKRNALPIFNALFRKSFFWDGGVPKLDFVPVNPIENELEMDEKMDNVVKKINTSTTYRSLFKNAFGTDTIASEHILKAYAQFMNGMISANSKYDKYIRKEGVQLTKDELVGLQIFTQKCSSCHPAPLFTDDSFRNNGLSNDNVDDKGREDITLNSMDRGKFKVPSLRNVALTAPYMHDGRFYKLEKVLDHYSNNVKKSNTLDPILNNSNKLGIALTLLEKKKIIAFLKTLTDYSLINDPQFSNPKNSKR
jgi:cytochrome c peroxidase